MDGLKSTLKSAGLHDYISSASEIIEEARAGRIFILVDDEDRENEGDLIIPAQFATPDAVNFMAKHARGLICLAMTRGRCERLGLPLMSQANGSRHETAFTVSIEAKEGVSTGISAADRARTISVAINSEMAREDIVTPGHVFPLMARDGGTLVRAGHTEAAVDIARLAGLIPAGVICEIMNDDGTMARLPDLVAFAQRHNLKLGTIADLIAHRRTTEKLVKRVEQGTYVTSHGNHLRVIAYENTVDHVEHVAFVIGDMSDPEPVPVRMHAVDTIADFMGGSHVGSLHGAIKILAEQKRGVVVLIRESRPNVISEKVRHMLQRTKAEPALRDYGIGAQILVDLGVKNMILLSNHERTIVGLEGYGINIVEQRKITATDDGQVGLVVSTADAELPVAPELPGEAPKILLIRAPYYRDVVDGMTKAANEILREVKAQVQTIDVAGAFELPQALRIALRGRQHFDGFVALGCVVRGETDHYEFICNTAMDGLMQVALQDGICLGTALLTVDTVAQAEARSRETGANKGAEAAVACLKQIAIARRLGAA